MQQQLSGVYDKIIIKWLHSIETCPQKVAICLPEFYTSLQKYTGIAISFDPQILSTLKAFLESPHSINPYYASHPKEGKENTLAIVWVLYEQKFIGSKGLNWLVGEYGLHFEKLEQFVKIATIKQINQEVIMKLWGYLMPYSMKEYWLIIMGQYITSESIIKLYEATKELQEIAVQPLIHQYYQTELLPNKLVQNEYYSFEESSVQLTKNMSYLSKKSDVDEDMKSQFENILSELNSESTKSTI